MKSTTLARTRDPEPKSRDSDTVKLPQRDASAFAREDHIQNFS